MIAMPMQRALYPADWEAISRSIRERAGWRCEACGVAQGTSLIGASGKPYDVVLTVAHLNHEPADVRPENLRAWCQTCHLRYDVEHHKRSRARHRHEAQLGAGQLGLWDAPPSSTPPTQPVRAQHSRSRTAENARVATPQPPQRSRSRAQHTQDAEPSESQYSASGGGLAVEALRAEPLVWGAWPGAEEPLVVLGDAGEAAQRRWVFAGPMACGKELLGVLLAPWEQRAERERVALRWVAIERVRRVMTVGETREGE